MNVLQADELIAAVRAQTVAQREQAEAINRLAESNQALVHVLVSDADDPEEGHHVPAASLYLSGPPRGA
ncbi:MULTISPECIES: hypothetical protein [unclassified Tatumella]|uniref:hypothetical protein n=1 Tax=unclassified Tatumella TaxID=2649542 RepID=UPI001BB08AD8|nr:MULTISPECIES: hypothetical protein [unclassified Tatumella]MBS0878585.1 hypothetical protein [Tatumella sp. JGM82]MBS0892082.1 hypothetical protein [Tatumella sp. JGM94]MBS0900861.1 hypothetical protein [Tatumella sp. JGM100]